jgi:hypothetical protein
VRAHKPAAQEALQETPQETLTKASSTTAANENRVGPRRGA